MLNPNASNSETTTPIPFQPMKFTDILDTTFSFYRNHFRLFVVISAVYAFWYLFFHITFPSTHWLTDWCVLVVDALSGFAGEVDFSEMIRQVIQIMGHNTEEADGLLFVITAVIDIFTMPILSIGITLLYFDQRIRKEGFDIEMMVSKEAM